MLYIFLYICFLKIISVYFFRLNYILIYDMKKILFILITIIYVFPGYAKSYDEKIAESMNAGDWFGLDSVYNAVPKDSIMSFLEVYSRFIIGNRFNRPDVSVPAFEELLAKHSQELSAEQLIGSAIMCAIDLNRVGDNAKAASILISVRDRIVKEGKEKDAKVLENFIKQYSSLAEYHPYTITFEGNVGHVPFRIGPAGRPEKQGVNIHLENSFINSLPADIILDTGAGVNVISTALVDKYNLIPIDVETKVSGAKSHNGTYAIAKELKIGNITVKDVPFYVMDITANNDEANQYLQEIQIIVGSDLMLQLKDVALDFENSCVVVPVESPVRSGAKPNMCFSSTMNLLAKGTIHGEDLLMNVDTGDCSYGTIGKDFYKKNKKLIKSKGSETSIRKAGIGGVQISKGYMVPDLTLNLGGCPVTVPCFEVMVKDDSFGYECNLGLKSLMLYRVVRFNLADFVLTTEQYSSPH